MVDLDNPLIYQQLDTSRMLNHLREFPNQCQRAWEKLLKFALPQEHTPIDKVIILGMGGSAIGGDILHVSNPAKQLATKLWGHLAILNKVDPTPVNSINLV